MGVDLSSKSSGAWKVAMDKDPLLKAAGNRPITAAPLVVRPNHRAMAALEEMHRG